MGPVQNIWHILIRPGLLRLPNDQISGLVLWRDELCFGPVPRGLDFTELARLRTEFWKSVTARRTPVPDPERLALLKSRSRPVPWFIPEDAVPALCSASEVVLWFGNSVASQLALLQCVDLIPEHVQVSIASVSIP